MKKLLRVLSFIFVLTMLTGVLASCSARPLAQSKLAKTSVGTVGEHTVLYEEFYYLASNYYSYAKEKYKDDAEAIEEYVLNSI